MRVTLLCATQYVNPRVQASDDRTLPEVRPGGPQADGGGYSDFDGRAATSSRHRASSVGSFEGPCAALDSAPPVEPPERTAQHFYGA